MVLDTIQQPQASSAAARLIAADVAFLTMSPNADLMLGVAGRAAAAEGDVNLEAAVLFRQAEQAFRSADNDELKRAHDRLAELGDGDPAVDGFTRIVRVWWLMNTNRYEEAKAFLGSVASDYAPTRAYEDYYRVGLWFNTGHTATAVDGLSELMDSLPGRVRDRANGMLSTALFHSGLMTKGDLQAVTELIQRIAASGNVQLNSEGSCAVAIMHLAIGDISTAREIVAQVEEASAIADLGKWTEHVLAMARAAILVVDGHEAAAAVELKAVMPENGPYSNLPRHLYQNAMTLAYVLVPSSRHAFESVEHGPDSARAIAIGQALVALRDNSDATPAAMLDWGRPEQIRAWAFELHFAELAVAAFSEGCEPARDALEGLRLDPHATLTAIADRSPRRVAASARSVLKSTPKRPTALTRIGLLGPFTVRGAENIDASVGSRRRVVELVALLALNRQLTRAEIAEAMWPELDERQSQNNLRVTLSYVRKVLEPDRVGTAVSWHLVTKGRTIGLHRSEFLQLDIEEFAGALRLARRADRDRLPRTAIGEYLRVCDLYRGDLLPELSESSIAALERTRFRLDFVSAAVRSASLLTAAGRADEALLLAQRAVEAEPLADEAHIALFGALKSLGRTPRSAQAACRAVFAEADLNPTASLRRYLETPPGE